MRARHLRFVVAVAVLLFLVGLVKALAVRNVGWGVAGTTILLPVFLLGSVLLGRFFGIRGVPIGVVVSVAALVAVPAIALTPWPYELEVAAKAVPVPTGGRFVAAARAGTMLCTGSCSTATMEYRYPAGTDVEALTRAAAGELAADRWELEVERPPPEDLPADARWIEATRPGLRLGIAVLPCPDPEGCPVALRLRLAGE